MRAAGQERQAAEELQCGPQIPQMNADEMRKAGIRPYPVQHPPTSDPTFTNCSERIYAICGKDPFCIACHWLETTRNINFEHMARQLHILSLLVALLTLGTARGQGFAPMDSVARNNELSVDITAFIRQFVPNNTNSLGNPYYYQPTYLLVYKRSLGKSALRFGVGGQYLLDSDTGGYNSHTDYTDYDWRLQFRAGWERRWSLNRRWSCYAGFDGLIGTGRGVSHNFGTQVGRPDVRTTSKSFGAGPMLGIQFHLNRRLSLYTEASLYWIYQETGTHYDFEDDANDRKALSTTGTIFFSYPLSVWFTLAF